LSDWVVNGFQPFAVVEQEDFKKFVETLRSGYPLPTRVTVKNRVMKLWEAERLVFKVKLEKLVSGRRVGMTTDMWTSAAGRGYMVITVHFIDDEWKMRNAVLAFKRVLYPHTSERLASHFLDAVNELSPELVSSLWAVTADNAATNPVMIEEMKKLIRKQFESRVAAADDGTVVPQKAPEDFFLIRCFANVVQLALKEGRKDAPSIDSSIGKFRDNFKKTSDSPELIETMQSLCATLKQQFHKFELDTPIRWNSTFHMIDTGIKLKPALVELLHRIRNRHGGYCDLSINPDDPVCEEIPESVWEGLSEFCKFLEIFRKITVIMEAKGHPTLGLVAPVYYLVDGHVARAIDKESEFKTAGMIKFATAVQRKIKEYGDVVIRP